jgi:hypothetical protein
MGYGVNCKFRGKSRNCIRGFIMENRSTPWPWVVVALVLAVAAVMITLIVVRGKGGAATGSTARIVDASLAHHKSRSHVVHTTVKTVTAPATVTQSAAAAGSAQGLQSCDQNISVNSATSCSFADNVFAAYANDVQSAGSPGSYQLYDIYSPATGDSYNDTCNYSSSSQVVTCSHGSDLIQFPEWAAAVYNG